MPVGRFLWIIFALCAGAFAPAAWSQKPVVVFGVPSINAGFNGDALDGAMAFQRLHGVKVDIKTTEGLPEIAQTYTRLVEAAAASGADPVVLIGFAFQKPVTELAPQFPKVHFVLIDAVAVAPNILNIVFRSEEAAYLAGSLAAMSSRTGVIGFVGGVDIPIIRNFGCGFAQGVRKVNAKAQVLLRMISTDNTGFNDAAGGQRAADALADTGTDVIFHAAGFSGTGVIAAAKRRGVLAIGADVNQNPVAPGTVLTSVLKRMNVAVYTALRDAHTGKRSTGIKELGLREHGVGLAIDQHNILMVDERKSAAVDQLEYAILTGSETVVRYSERDGCPYLDFGSDSRQVKK